MTHAAGKSTGDDREGMRASAEQMVRGAQDRICDAISALEGSELREDAWQRPGGGGGVSRVLQDGDVFEKAGVNVAVVHGELPAEAARSMGGGAQVPEGASSVRFFAAGVSTVIHPRNPMAPTAHANYRYFELEHDDRVCGWWFGGGSDLTPAYLFEEDAVHFHRIHREVCDRFDASYYPRFKPWCDRYFHIRHRGESRGIGGIFFDDLHDREPGELLQFCRAAAAGFVDAYFPIVERRMEMPYGDEQRRWQLLRRGRYVEFNLVYDRGTSFGLQTGGRIESILMSLPLTARWEYAHEPPEGSEEAKLLAVLREPRDWVGRR
jgi:coproporphyrinogen III oxidase